MRSVIGASFAVAAALLAANMLGVASAEAPTSTASPRTVSVQGVAKVPVAQGASTTLANESYRQAMAAAVSDGLGKAEYLAGKTGVGLGPVQSVVENGGSISCVSGPEGEYVQYSGEQPDVPLNGVSSGPQFAAPAARSVSPLVRRAKPKHGKTSPKAKKATAGGCSLSAQVSLVYAIT